MRNFKSALWLLLIACTSFAQVPKTVTKTVIKIPAGDTAATRQWVREYLQSVLTPMSQTSPVVVDTDQPNCGCSSADFPVTITSKGNGSYQVAFDGCNISPLYWEITNSAGDLIVNREFVPVSGLFDLSLNGQPKGDYTLKITSSKCRGKGTAAFRILPAKELPVVTPVADAVIPVTADRLVDPAGKIVLQPLKDPLLPALQQSGNYELRYLESRPDAHLDLRLEEKNGQLYLTDTGHSLQSVSYTLNGWTDSENCGKLENEPIVPYRLYHLSKYSIARPTIREVWMATYATPKADFRRSELFFYAVPKSETWNPAGESANPIGRPAAFSHLPDFKLKNRVYGFEYEFLDESKERLDGLDITFNRKAGGKHLKLYSNVLVDFIQRKGYTNPQKPFHEFSESDCIEFANELPIDLIVAFDIEPYGWDWIIDYAHPNFGHNMKTVIHRLRERGAMAYNWLDVPDKSPNNMSLDGYLMGPYLRYGKENADVLKYREAYGRIGELGKRDNPYSVISTGYGYTSYDNNLSPNDGNGENVSPQLTYLKSLDASELWRRAWPDKEQVYFSWPFQETEFVSFPQNHVVEIPAHQARARRTDNKPLYPPTQWEDNMTLGLLTAKYLFYWCPGPVGWNPANTSQYNNAYTNGFSVWTFEQGKAPLTDKFYIGKEAMAINATLKAAYRYSLIQDAMDGSRTAPQFNYKRAAKDGSTPAAVTVDAITNGSWYIDALVKRQPFALVCENNGKRVLLVQDVWARPGRFTEFEVEVGGRVYTGRTEGNRLFIAPL